MKQISKQKVVMTANNKIEAPWSDKYHLKLAG
jgi:hypothetical protein